MGEKIERLKFIARRITFGKKHAYASKKDTSPEGVRMAKLQKEAKKAVKAANGDLFVAMNSMCKGLPGYTVRRGNFDPYRMDA